MAVNSQQEKPTWAEYLKVVEHRDLVAACAVLSLARHSPVARDAVRWLGYSQGDGRYVDGVFQPDPVLDWDSWVADVTEHGRGWSHGEGRLYALVAGLAADRPLVMSGVLDCQGGMAPEIWRILAAWGCGMPGRDLKAYIAA